ncbi:MAG: permease-like cell division protein FtsX [Bacteroidales bacterium]|mgnify:FL=1|jgi:cell division transport system permease protein|nr:permease-like cell division protein FtsX [Bacteroidales bacterium]MBQ1655114.1 permease-like cell division protein FtsX [Bacteroidales bacterium]MBQ1731986.1 permease-like cell division protein FtsX [Bacteroidales bacterium]MBQ2352255.1 permease-like cell division protein FtsX [Bacteroidales bacterium]MBQ2572836.1 permease-like cell division protein FtsX [Bacteroidales bacterium]
MKKSNIKNRIRGAYFTSVVSISLVLLLLGIVGLLMLNAKQMSDYVKENLCFSLIINDDVSEPDIKQFQKSLDTHEFIKSTEYITKDDAAKQLQEELGENFIETLGYNPLSPTINVYLNSDYASPDSIAKLEGFFLSKSNIVNEVSYQQNLVNLIHDNIKKVSIILLALSALFFLISFALLNNTIRLQIYSKRFIINTMKLVGAKKGFIRRPFIASGALQGLVSSIIAIALLYGIIYFANSQLENIMGSIDPWIIALLFVAVAVIGVLLCVFATLLSINKYLRLKTINLYY